MKKSKSKERIFYIIMTLIVAVVIFYSSGIQTTAGENKGLNLSMFYHFGIFFMFTFFLTLSITNKNLNKKTIAIIFLISLIYAISDEFHQLFVIGRFATPKDVLVDMAGSICSIFIIKSIGILKNN